VQSVVESLHAAGRCPRLHVNALAEGVVCPDFIREQWRERLIIDLDSSYPLNLTFEDESIGADLSFGGFVTRCSFPFTAIYVVADRQTGRGIELDQHMPESVRESRKKRPAPGPAPDAGPRAAPKNLEVAKVQEESPPEVETSDEERAKRRRAAFKVIDGGG
jgi:stringent starvation protein B